jgi:hypothetical protein
VVSSRGAPYPVPKCGVVGVSSAQYMRKTMIRNNIGLDQESVTFSGDCFDIGGRATDLCYSDSVYSLLLGYFKYPEKDFVNQYPP